MADELPPAVKTLQWDEIQKHDKPNDCWVVYDGKVYDMTDFIPKHPGGATLWWQGGGRDITILFNISHPPRVTVQSHLEKYGKYMGQADGPEVPGAPEYDWQSPMWVELKEKCWNKLFDMVKHHRGYEEGKFAKVTYGEWDLNLYFSILVILNIATLIACYVLPVFFHSTPVFWKDYFFWQGIVVAIFIRGPLIAMCATMMHEARHRASCFLWYAASDLSGMSSLRYQIEHSWHHNWPNCPAGEVEQSFAYAPGMRHFTWQKHRCWNRCQLLYWPFSFALVFLTVALSDVTDFFCRGHMGMLRRGSWTCGEFMLFVAGKFMVIASFFWPLFACLLGFQKFSLLGYVGYLIVVLFVWFGSSFWMTLINVPAHLTMDELVNADIQDTDFAKTQIAHSRTFSAGSTFMTWFTLGTNTQTEHHLFPTVPFRYLMALTPIIQEVSEKHGVVFNSPYDSFCTVFKLYLDRVAYLSKPAAEEETGLPTARTTSFARAPSALSVSSRNLGLRTGSSARTLTDLGGRSVASRRAAPGQDSAVAVGPTLLTSHPVLQASTGSKPGEGAAGSH